MLLLEYLISVVYVKGIFMECASIREMCACDCDLGHVTAMELGSAECIPSAARPLKTKQLSTMRE